MEPKPLSEGCDFRTNVFVHKKYGLLWVKLQMKVLTIRFILLFMLTYKSQVKTVCAISDTKAI